MPLPDETSPDEIPGGSASLPLAGYVVEVADRPSAYEAGRLLSGLGMHVSTVAQAELLRCGDIAVAGHDGAGADAAANALLADWAESGLMALTVGEDGSPLRPRGVAATVARGAAHALDLVSRLRDTDPVVIDGAQILGERAALAGRHTAPPDRPARLLRARDGWWVLNLARDDDFELVPPLLQREATTWESVAGWSASLTSEEVVGRARLLGLAAARLGETPAPDLPWTAHVRTATAAGRPRPRVVNLGSLWAAPLTANLLACAGYDVVHVESQHRPDASRWGDPGLYRRLRAGADIEQVDFRSASGRARLRSLLAQADVVIEASRPRALRSLGVDRATICADGRARTWLQITAHGQRGPDWIGYGDDTAVSGGLVADGADGPVLAGDALADPLTGLVGALAVLGHHDDRLITWLDVALADVAAYCHDAGSIEWPITTSGTWPVRLPEAAAPRLR